MEKTINIDGRDLKLKTDAGLLRKYREWLHSDLLVDFQGLIESLTSEKGLIPENYTTFENITYAMARYADSKVPKDIDKWLAKFGTFSIINALDEVVELWNEETKTFSEPKKENEQ